MKDRILPILFILFFILPVQAKREPDLYKKADKSLYDAKAGGKGCYVYYEA